MLLKSGEMAYTGVMMALTVLLVTLGGYIEGSTLFFLAAASFFVGIVQRKLSMGTAGVFLVGSTLLSLFLAPQKLYCATFLAFGVYILVAEVLYKCQNREQHPLNPKVVWIIKGIIYHIMLVVFVVLAGNLTGFTVLFEKGVLHWLQDYKVLCGVALVVFAEALWLLFDKAYFFFQERYGKYLTR